MSDKSSGYLIPTTNTAYGNHSSDNATVRGYYKSNDGNSVTLSPADPRNATVGNFESSKEALALAGLLDPNAVSLSKEGHAAEARYQVQNQREQQAVQKANAEVEAIHREFNADYDALESRFSNREQFNSFADAAAGDLDERALAIVPDGIVNGYIHQAESWAKSHGLNSIDAMSIVLDEYDQRAARLAVINGNAREFGKYVQKTLNEARSLAHEEWFIEEVEAAGGKIRGGNLIVNGQVFDVGQAILTGILKFDG